MLRPERREGSRHIKSMTGCLFLRSQCHWPEWLRRGSRPVSQWRGLPAKPTGRAVGMKRTGRGWQRPRKAWWRGPKAPQSSRPCPTSPSCPPASGPGRAVAPTGRAPSGLAQARPSVQAAAESCAGRKPGLPGTRGHRRQVGGGFLCFFRTQPQGKWAPPPPEGIKSWVGTSWLPARCGQPAHLVLQGGADWPTATWPRFFSSWPLPLVKS